MSLMLCLCISNDYETDLDVSGGAHASYATWRQYTYISLLVISYGLIIVMLEIKCSIQRRYELFRGLLGY